jgi:hypothetical protein
MSELGYVTNVDYRAAFGVGRHAATAALSAWLAEGVLVREGNGATRATDQALDGLRVDCRKICRVCPNLRLISRDR